MKPLKSPCVNICEFVGPNGWCIGCGRTRAECQQWKKMRPYKQQILRTTLKKRMAQMIEPSQ